VKDLAAREKQAVGLEERRKHANGKAKKLKKAHADVREFRPIYRGWNQLLTVHGH
jgi:hypothetical protein